MLQNSWRALTAFTTTAFARPAAVRGGECAALTLAVAQLEYAGADLR